MFVCGFLHVGFVTGICYTCFLIRCVMVVIAAFDKKADMHVLNHPILDFFYYMGNNVHGLGDSVSLGIFASELLAWEIWSNFPHKRYVEEAKSYAQLGCVAEKKAFFEAHYTKVAAQKAAAAAPAAALLEQEKANEAASCHKYDVEERVCGSDHGAHDLLIGISNFDASKSTMLHPIKLPQPPVLNLKMFVNERKQVTTQDSSKTIDAAAQSSTISLTEPRSAKIVVTADRNKATSNNTDNLEDHPSVSEDSGTSQMDCPLLKVQHNVVGDFDWICKLFKVVMISNIRMFCKP